jgi:thioredoxin 1
MKKNILALSFAVAILLSNCYAGTPVKTSTTSGTGAVIPLTNVVFKQKVFNYEINKSWKFEGNLPVIIDFYATWCGPCRQLSPIVEELAKKYNGKIIVYKVDTDQESQLAQSMGIQNLPTLLFIPVKGQPQSSVGLVPRETVEKAIREVLLVK